MKRPSKTYWDTVIRLGGFQGLFLIKLKNSGNAQNIAYIWSLSYNEYRLLTLQRKLKNGGMGRLAEVLRALQGGHKEERPGMVSKRRQEKQGCCGEQGHSRAEGGRDKGPTRDPWEGWPCQNCCSEGCSSSSRESLCPEQ